MFKEEPNIEMVYCSRDGQIREALSERGVSFAPISDLTVKEIKRVIREQQPDLIHAHDMRASFIAALSSGRIPLVSHIHNNSFDSRGMSLKSILYLVAATKAKKIIWVSDSAKKEYAFKRFVDRKSVILYNIINIDALYDKMSLDPNTYNFDIVYLGRLSEPKDPSRLLDVLQLVVQMKPDARIAIIGTGELEESVHAKARTLQLMGNIQFLGFRGNPYKILRDAKVMIMTSKWEGTPMCVLESLALGVPVVSTPTDGLKDLIKNGYNGFLSNNDRELADSLYQIICNDDMHDAMSISCKKYSAEFNDRENYSETITAIYSRALNG